MSSVWPQEMTAELMKWQTIGLSASEMMVVLSQVFPARRFTRNAIIGKLHRMGLPVGGNEPHGGRKKPAKPKSIVNAGAILHSMRASARVSMAFPKLPKIKALPSMQAQETNPSKPRKGVSFWQIKSNQCHWPIGESILEKTFYCGARALVGCSYCADHKRMMRAGWKADAA